MEEVHEACESPSKRVTRRVARQLQLSQQAAAFNEASVLACLPEELVLRVVRTRAAGGVPRRVLQRACPSLVLLLSTLPDAVLFCAPRARRRRRETGGFRAEAARARARGRRRARRAQPACRPHR
jgi:hypothetical protein